MKKLWNAIKAMTMFERLWLVIVTACITGATVYFSVLGTDYANLSSVVINWIFSPVSALTGCACVVLAARGSIWNVPVGVLNALCYGIVAWYTGYYGDFLLNIFFFLPTQYLVWKGWTSHLATKDITIMRRLSFKQIILGILAGVVFSVALGYVLHSVDSFAINVLKRSASIYVNIDKALGIPMLGPVMDATTEFTQIAAQVLMILRFAEQWVLWIVTDVVSMVMWATVVATDSSSYAYSIPTPVMFTAWLINTVYGAINWYRGAQK